MSLARRCIRYAESSYWEERYKQQPSQSFDWFYGYHALRLLLRTTLSRSKVCLQVGCGNSALQEGMARDNYTVVNIDISKVIIEQMSVRHKHIPNLSYRVADVTNMPELVDCSFGSVVEKGTVDALLCHEDGSRLVDAMFTEIFRVLQHGCTFLLITLGEPMHRLKYIRKEKYLWTVHVYLLPRIPEMEAAKDVSNNASKGASSPAASAHPPIDPIGPLRIDDDGQPVGLPQPWEPGKYFYAYACKKPGAPLSASQSINTSGCWSAARKEEVARVQREMGLSPDILTRGLRRNSVKVPVRESVQRKFNEKEALLYMVESRVSPEASRPAAKPQDTAEGNSATTPLLQPTEPTTKAVEAWLLSSYGEIQDEISKMAPQQVLGTTSAESSAAVKQAESLAEELHRMGSDPETTLIFKETSSAGEHPAAAAEAGLRSQLKRQEEALKKSQDEEVSGAPDWMSEALGPALSDRLLSCDLQS